MKLAVLDYGIGNLASACKAFEHLGAGARLSADATEIAAADAVVLPGVGSFGACMGALTDRGLDRVALAAIAEGRPFLGICVGMQMLCAGSEESPDRAGLGVFDTMVRRLPAGVKHPQMQWNQLIATRPEHPMFAGLVTSARGPDAAPVTTAAAPWVYFVHSFAAEANDATIATCDYGGACVAALSTETTWALQFHPEKSSHTGLEILANFLRWAERST